MKKFIIIFPILIGGCATNWEHPTASQSDFHRDRAICSNEAEVAIPRVYIPVSNSFPTTYSTYNTDCSNIGGFISCTSTPSQVNNNYAIAQMNQSIAQSGENMRRGVDVNNYFRNCMFAKGYRVSQPATSGLFHTSTPAPKVLPFTNESEANLSLRDSMVKEKVSQGYEATVSKDGRTFIRKDGVIHGWVLESGMYKEIRK
jgi:hypothetical protein